MIIGAYPSRETLGCPFFRTIRFGTSTFPIHIVCHSPARQHTRRSVLPSTDSNKHLKVVAERKWGHLGQFSRETVAAAAHLAVWVCQLVISTADDIIIYWKREPKAPNDGVLWLRKKIRVRGEISNGLNRMVFIDPENVSWAGRKKIGLSNHLLSIWFSTFLTDDVVRENVLVGLVSSSGL